MEIENVEYYIFGSYLRTSNFKDIDVLIVVPELCVLDLANEFLSLLKEENISSIVHTHLYLKSEYLNPQNKFSYKNVNHQISFDDFIALFKIERFI
tara:strand:+ start:847 stop:1134 length:288 start_codon:yes stop_codon:yes gene_type:complete